MGQENSLGEKNHFTTSQPFRLCSSWFYRRSWKTPPGQHFHDCATTHETLQITPHSEEKERKQPLLKRVFVSNPYSLVDLRHPGYVHRDISDMLWTGIDLSVLNSWHCIAPLRASIIAAKVSIVDQASKSIQTSNLSVE
jgi:hypothetical protein